MSGELSTHYFKIILSPLRMSKPHTQKKMAMGFSGTKGKDTKSIQFTERKQLCLDSIITEANREEARVSSVLSFLA